MQDKKGRDIVAQAGKRGRKEDEDDNWRNRSTVEYRITPPTGKCHSGHTNVTSKQHSGLIDVSMTATREMFSQAQYTADIITGKRNSGQRNLTSIQANVTANVTGKCHRQMSFTSKSHKLASQAIVAACSETA
jgi:hypothetical protein